MSAVGKNLGDRTYKCCVAINFGFWESGGYGHPRHVFFEIGYEYGGI